MRPAIPPVQLLCRRLLFRVAVAAGLLAVASPSACAQQRTFVDTVSKKALAESLRVVDSLDKFTRAHPQNAAAWSHLGNLSALLLRHSRATRPEIDRVELDRHALDGLQRAVKYDSTNAAYWAGLARFGIGANGKSSVKDADASYAKALELSRAHGDSALLADLLVERGSIEMSRNGPARRNFLQTTPSGSFRDEMFSYDGRVMGEESVWRAAGDDTAKDLPRLLRTAIDNVTHNARPVPFERAREDSYHEFAGYLGEAHDLAPADPRAYEGLATVYVSRGRWNELAALAADRTTRAPDDPSGWLALGLAKQRLHASGEAEAALTKGFARMKSADRAWLDRVDRILDPRDSVVFASASAATRAETARLLWQNADPLWAADNETPRVEFLARLAFAELRWSDTTNHVHGADTRLGELYVRYGPPDKVVSNFWIYNSGLIFTANLYNSRYNVPARPDRDADDQDITERIRRWQPSRWDNISLARIDSMPTQVARFREGADSIGFFLATQAPMADLRRVTASNQKAVAHFWLDSRDGGTRLADSLVLGGTGEMQFARRVPSGPYYYRVESTVPGALLAARTAAPILMGPDTTGFASTGFGMSDVLVASRVTPHATVSRWSDFDVTPVLGDIARGSNVAFVWENYDLGARDGRAAYTLKITLERKWKLFLNKIRARIINAWGAMRGVEQTSERVVYTYDRTAAQAPVITDYITLQFADTPAGNYDVTISLLDNVTGKSTSRTMRVVIRE